MSGRRRGQAAPTRNTRALLATIRAAPGQTAKALNAHASDLVALESECAIVYMRGPVVGPTEREPGTWWPVRGVKNP